MPRSKPQSKYVKEYKFLENYSFVPVILLMISISLLISQSVHALYKGIFNVTLISVMSLGVTILSYIANEIILKQNSKIQHFTDKRAVAGLLIIVPSIFFSVFLGVYFLMLTYEKSLETNVYFCKIYHIITIIILSILFGTYVFRTALFLYKKNQKNQNQKIKITITIT